MILRVEEPALAEAREHVLYYMRRNPRAAENLTTAIENALRAIAAAPTT